MPVAHEPFRLSPQEDWIFGVRMRGDVLSFGPSGSVVAMVSFAGVAMGAMGALMALGGSSGSTINGYTVKNPTALVVMGILVVVYAAGFLVASLLVGVRANDEGVVIRHLWRRRRLPWASIVAVRAHETEPRRWRMFWGPNVAQARMNLIASWSVGVIELVDGTIVQLPGFDAAARDDGLSLGLPTATELKVQALARYMSVVTGRPIDTAAPAPARIEDPDDAWSVWMLLGYIGGAFALWLLVSWAAGTIVSPFFLVVGAVVGLYQFASHRRAG